MLKYRSKEHFLSAFWRRPYSANSNFALSKVLLAAEIWGPVMPVISGGFKAVGVVKAVGRRPRHSE